MYVHIYICTTLQDKLRLELCHDRGFDSHYGFWGGSQVDYPKESMIIYILIGCVTSLESLIPSVGWLPVGLLV